MGQLAPLHCGTELDVGGAVQVESSRDPALETAWFQPLFLSSVISWFQRLLFQTQLALAYASGWSPRWPSRWGSAR
jgi:hypothetical protein